MRTALRKQVRLRNYGSKVFFLVLDNASLVVMARTAKPGAGGVSAFVVAAMTQGVEYGKAEEKMGLECANQLE